ncbi:MAG: hypothetical protein AB1698_20665 [Pseudomonadota bacterium]
MGGGGSAPKPDPNIGIAAMKSAETGEQWLQVAKEQFGVANERQAKLDALTEKVTNSQITSMEQANEWAAQDRERYIGTFRPMEDEFIETAKNWDSAERQTQVAAEAKADVLNAGAQAQAARERSLTGMGVNPNSGRFAGVAAAGDQVTALASAGAQNNARTTLRNQAVALKSDAINLGKGLPSQAAQSLGPWREHRQLGSGQQRPVQRFMDHRHGHPEVRLHDRDAGLRPAGEHPEQPVPEPACWMAEAAGCRCEERRRPHVRHRLARGHVHALRQGREARQEAGSRRP